MKRLLLACRGFALASAIFLLVILSALGAFILNISTAQHTAAAFDVLGERAYQAAYAGLEWARYKVWSNASFPISAGSNFCPGGADAWNAATTTSITLTGTQTLSDFTVTVECRRRADADVAGVQSQVYEIRATACNKPEASEPKCKSGDSAANPSTGSFGYMERQVSGLVMM